MLKLSTLQVQKSLDVTTQVPSEYAMHAMNVDANGRLTYTKTIWNSNESIDINTAEGDAFWGPEEFMAAVTSDNQNYNLVPPGDKANLVSGYSTTRDFTVSYAGTRTVNIDGVANGTINLTRGSTYRFFVNDSYANTGNVNYYGLAISNAASLSTTHRYTKGVTNSAIGFSTTTPALTFTVPDDAPDILYYVTPSQGAIGRINIQKRRTTNQQYRKHDQVRFDTVPLTYYVNSAGFLVARYNQPYTSNTFNGQDYNC